MEFRIFCAKCPEVNGFYSYLVRDAGGLAAKKAARSATYEMRAAMTAYRRDFSPVAHRTRG